MQCQSSKKDYPFLLVKREHEIVITTMDGKEIANIIVQSMEDDQGEFTDNFFLVFNTAEKMPVDKNIASVFLK